jgi:hypothetical protein
MKKLTILLLSLALPFTPMVGNEEVEKELAAEQAEVQMWISLINKVEQSYFDVTTYPEELHHYQIHLLNNSEAYMIKVEEAELAYHEGQDYKTLITEAEVYLEKNSKLKEIFDRYVDYTKRERSPTYLEETRKALLEKKALPRMHYDAYTVFRGEYPIEVNKIRSRLPFIKKFVAVYSNGDKAHFTNEKLTHEELSNE